MPIELKLTKAAREGDLEAVNRLLHRVGKIPPIIWLYLGSSYNKYVTANNNEALRKAVEYNHEAIVQRLLQVPAIVANATANHNEALNIARRQDNIAIANLLLQIEAVQDLDIGRQRPRNIGLQINTHTVSVHASVSTSALNLSHKYGAIKYQENMSNIIPSYFSAQMRELRGLISKALGASATPRDLYIRTSIQATIAYVKKETWRDHVSNITVSRVFELLLIGIKQISNAETQKNAYLQLCASLYLLKHEYGTSRSCPSGFFNGLVYSQQTTLPNEVSIVVQSPELATNALRNKLDEFAIDILKNSNFANINEFEAAVLDQAIKRSIGVAIMREILDEFYTVFNYANAASATKANQDELRAHCVRLYGCSPEILFDNLPPNYVKIYEAKKINSGPKISFVRF